MVFYSHQLQYSVYNKCPYSRVHLAASLLKLLAKQFQYFHSSFQSRNYNQLTELEKISSSMSSSLPEMKNFRVKPISLQKAHTHSVTSSQAKQELFYVQTSWNFLQLFSFPHFWSDVIFTAMADCKLQILRLKN